MGDRNTKYFHGTTIIRRRRNRIEKLLNDNNEWINQPEEMESLVTSFYKDLFCDPGGATRFCLSNAFPSLGMEMLSEIGKPINNDEIKQAIKRMGRFKAPGPAIFFQSQWNLIGPDVCKLIHDIEEQPARVANINETLIVFIPKVEAVNHLRQMRPISLCNVSYKILSKVLAHRLSKVMDLLVHPNQCSFVPYKNSRDNIIVFQEVIHSMRFKTGKKGWMAIKIDLEKAYDRLNWKFIKETLIDIGLPNNFVELVWACISSGKLRMMWNGEALEEFLPSRGVRQGDPISPYLFVLCMERLFQLINMTIDHRLWKPIQLSRNGPMISHLAFADDIVLFAEASLDQVEVIQGCLNVFCDSAGQKVSNEKTRIFFSKNVGHVVRSEISNAFGFQRTENLGNYLGVPTHHSRVSHATYQSIIDKVNNRLSGWKAKNLSFAGRITLTKSVLEALPSYIMQTVSLPKTVCDALEKSSRGFLWGDNSEHHRPHAINWNTICLPKSHGGLGLRHMREANNAFMMKNCWSLISEPDKLWVRVVKTKYGCTEEAIPNISKKAHMSNLWHGICVAWKRVKPYIRWKIKDGRQTRFWFDVWVPGMDALINYARTYIPTSELSKCVCGYVTEDGNWEVSHILHLVPNSVW
uniref:Retrovirus-related Pol polyprotein LINE-1 n=1 Tax=Cajanus cajan TaxID=3821 RepID=A0A151T1X8_CAJCA|nr:Retrovirus-related Pol polyprotein LINE-1 [Cajanus cajan]